MIVSSTHLMAEVTGVHLFTRWNHPYPGPRAPVGNTTTGCVKWSSPLLFHDKTMNTSGIPSPTPKLLSQINIQHVKYFVLIVDFAEPFLDIISGLQCAFNYIKKYSKSPCNFRLTGPWFFISNCLSQFLKEVEESAGKFSRFCSIERFCKNRTKLSSLEDLYRLLSTTRGCHFHIFGSHMGHFLLCHPAL